MTVMTLSPQEKVAIIGPNGSGKSYLALGYVGQMASALVHDVKSEIDLPGFAVTDNPQDLLRYPRCIYRAPLLGDPVEAGDILGWAALKRHGTCVYLDEAALAAPGQRIGPWLRAAIITGRSLGVGVWAAMQRPMNVHNLLLSEAWAYLVSPFLLSGDKAKVAGFVKNVETFCSQPWPRYTFAYYRRGEDTWQPIRAA